MAEPTMTEQFAAAEADADAWEAAHPDAARKLASPVQADEPEEDATEEAPTEGDEAATDDTSETPKPPAAAAKPTVDPAQAKREQLTALAAELGMKVVGEQVAVEERVKFREEKRAHREQRAAWEAQANKLLTERIQPTWNAIKLIEEGDLDGGLKALTGKDLTELNKDAIASASGADWQTRREMQRLRAEREQEKAEREQWRAQEQQRQQTAQAQAYVGQVQMELTKSEDKAIAGLAAELPWFAEAVVAEQRVSYDPEDGSSLLTSVAAGRVLDKYRVEYERVHKILGGPVAPKKAESGVQAPAKPAQSPNGKHPGGTTAGGQLAAGRRSARLSDEEWMRTAKKEMAEAVRAESNHT